MAKPSIGFEIGRKTEKAGPVGEIEPGTDQQFQALPLGLFMSPHHAGQAVAIGDGDGFMAERSGGDHQLMRVRRSFEEGEIGGDLKLDVAHGLHRYSIFSPQRSRRTRRKKRRRQSLSFPKIF